MKLPSFPPSLPFPLSGRPAPLRMLSALAAAVGLVAGAPAFAASSSSAVLGNFTVTLEDLDPDDGVTPWIQFDFRGDAHMEAQARDPATGWVADTAHVLYWDYEEPVGAAAINARTQASAGLTGLAGMVGVGLHATGSSDGSTTPGEQASFWARVYLPYFYGGYAFTVSSQTRVSFTIDYALHAAVTHAYTGDWNTQYETAYADAQLNISGTGADGFGEQQTSDFASVDVFTTSSHYVYDPVTGTYTPHHGGAADGASGVLSGSFVNATDWDLIGYVQLSAYAAGNSLAPAVPEPATWALWGGGLGLLLARSHAARNRRRSTASH